MKKKRTAQARIASLEKQVEIILLAVKLQAQNHKELQDYVNAIGRQSSKTTEPVGAK